MSASSSNSQLICNCCGEENYLVFCTSCKDVICRKCYVTNIEMNKDIITKPSVAQRHAEFNNSNMQYEVKNAKIRIVQCVFCKKIDRLMVITTYENHFGGNSKECRQICKLLNDIYENDKKQIFIECRDHWNQRFEKEKILEDQKNQFDMQMLDNKLKVAQQLLDNQDKFMEYNMMIEDICENFRNLRQDIPSFLQNMKKIMIEFKHTKLSLSNDVNSDEAEIQQTAMIMLSNNAVSLQSRIQDTLHSSPIILNFIRLHETMTELMTFMSSFGINDILHSVPHIVDDTTPLPQLTKVCCANFTCGGVRVNVNGRCTICEQFTCFECRCIIQENHVCDPDTVSTVKEIESSTQTCPKCFTPITRIGGCLDMVCPLCVTFYNHGTGKMTPNNRPNSNPTGQMLIANSKKYLSKTGIPQTDAILALPSYRLLNELRNAQEWNKLEKPCNMTRECKCVWCCIIHISSDTMHIERYNIKPRIEFSTVENCYKYFVKFRKNEISLDEAINKSRTCEKLAEKHNIYNVILEHYVDDVYMVIRNLILQLYASKNGNSISVCNESIQEIKGIIKKTNAKFMTLSRSMISERPKYIPMIGGNIRSIPETKGIINEMRWERIVGIMMSHMKGIKFHVTPMIQFSIYTSPSKNSFSTNIIQRLTREYINKVVDNHRMSYIARDTIDRNRVYEIIKSSNSYAFMQYWFDTISREGGVMCELEKLRTIRILVKHTAAKRSVFLQRRRWWRVASKLATA